MSKNTKSKPASKNSANKEGMPFEGHKRKKSNVLELAKKTGQKVDSLLHTPQRVPAQYYASRGDEYAIVGGKVYTVSSSVRRKKGTYTVRRVGKMGKKWEAAIKNGDLLPLGIPDPVTRIVLALFLSAKSVRKQEKAASKKKEGK